MASDATPSEEVLEAGHQRRPPVPRRLVIYALLVVLTAALAASTALAVHYRARASQASAAPTSHLRPTARSAGTPLLTMSKHTYALPTGVAHAKVVIIASTMSTTKVGQVVVTASLADARPHVRYRLIGGDCAHAAHRWTWAGGVTGSDGSAALDGSVRALPKDDQYWLWIEPWRHHPAGVPTGFRDTPPGLEGIWIRGQSLPLEEAQPPCPEVP